ncbi:DMT family transporter [Hoeflea prorocentri]|uniref:DMT family transporter n=1 Tax=Hoeflea prorocentri TaxID=1922333 RepID=A0A9X3ZFW7_9HYPH|nr:DMT family transporter [Hoeflea prorocentri]MCY6379574.1 DMT family transporter [Hoeflea prorocentri]MDA5397374.1 DMT family transporter [Hoeflea prorocentri]
MSRTKANLLLLLAGAVWGMGFVAQSTAMDAIGPMLFVSLRFLLATIVVMPFALLEAKRASTALQPGEFNGFVVIGVVLFAGMATQQVGLLTTTVTNAGFLTGLYVVIVPFLMVIFLRRKPHPVVWPSSFLALAGIWLLSGGGITALNGGDVLVIICAVFWAFQVLLVGVYGTRSARPLMLSVIQFGSCAVLAFVAAMLFEPIRWPAILDAAPEILYSGIFSSGLAFTLQAIGQRYTTSAQAAIFLSSEALFAALFGVVLLGEKISAVGYLGCALIFAAILAVEIIPSRLKRRHNRAKLAETVHARD